MITRRRFLAGAAALLTAGGLGAGYATAVEPGMRLVVQRYRLDPPRWPAGARLSIAVIADPHAGAPHVTLARLERIVATANGLAPDLVVCLGDYLASHRFVTETVPIADVAGALSGLRSRLGVVAILGNHDWWWDEEAQRTGGPTRAQRALEAAGIPVLHNEAVRIEADGTPVWLLGLGDQLALRRPHGGFRGLDDLPGTLAMVGDEAPAILLAHEPDIFPRVPDRISLTLAGHTHGGQIRVFGFSPVVPSRYGNRYAYGHIVEEGRHLVVSGGIGCSIAPVRLGVPPEITVVELGAGGGAARAAVWTG